MIRSRGCVPLACAAFIGEHSFSSSETPIAVARPDTSDAKHAELFGKRIKEKLLSIISIKYVSDIAVPGNYPYQEFKPWVLDFIEINNKCSQCGVCVQLCPVDAITLKNTVWVNIDKEKWVLCCACIKACPENALTVKNR